MGSWSWLAPTHSLTAMQWSACVIAHRYLLSPCHSNFWAWEADGFIQFLFNTPQSRVWNQLWQIRHSGLKAQIHVICHKSKLVGLQRLVIRPFQVLQRVSICSCSGLDSSLVCFSCDFSWWPTVHSGSLFFQPFPRFPLMTKSRSFNIYICEALSQTMWTALWCVYTLLTAPVDLISHAGFCSCTIIWLYPWKPKMGLQHWVWLEYSYWGCIYGLRI